MTKFLLFACSLAISTLGFSQDSLFSKVYASTDHDYLIKDQVKDNYGNIAQVGRSELNKATYTYLDSLGNVLFSKEYYWTNGPSASLQFRKVKATSDGNFIAVGDFFMVSQGANVGICAKIDSTGTLIWTKALVPANPVFFECSDVIESSENTFWVSGQDVQTGEISVLEIDQDGTQLQSFSFATSGSRLENKTILELGTNQLALVGAQLDQSGNAKGHVLSIDKTGIVLWSKIYNGIRFLAAQNDTNSVWIASSNNNQMAIATLSFDGTPVRCMTYNVPVLSNDYIGFSCLKDSTLAFCSSLMNNPTNLISTHPDGSNALSSYLVVSGVSIIPSSHGGLYFAGNGPLYGVKSSNNTYNHSALIRIDSLLSEGTCSYSSGTVTATDLALNATTSSVTSVSASSVNTATLGVLDQPLQSYIGCVDFYSGLDELDANNLTVFPNPANDFIRLQFENATSGVIEIMTMDGKMVQQSKVSDNNASVSIEKLVAGTYMYRFTSSNHAVSRGKLIVE